MEGNLNAVPFGDSTGSLGEVTDGVSFGDARGPLGERTDGVSLGDTTVSLGDLNGCLLDEEETTASLGEATSSVGDFELDFDEKMGMDEDDDDDDDFPSGGIGALPLECAGCLLTGIGNTLCPCTDLKGLVAANGGDLVAGVDLTDSVGVVFCPKEKREEQAMFTNVRKTIFFLALSSTSNSK